MKTEGADRQKAPAVRFKKFEIQDGYYEQLDLADELGVDGSIFYFGLYALADENGVAVYGDEDFLRAMRVRRVPTEDTGRYLEILKRWGKIEVQEYDGISTVTLKDYGKRDAWAKAVPDVRAEKKFSQGLLVGRPTYGDAIKLTEEFAPYFKNHDDYEAGLVLVYMSLWGYADEDGMIPDDAELIFRSTTADPSDPLFPLKDIEEYLALYKEIGKVVQVERDGKRLIRIVDFGKPEAWAEQGYLGVDLRDPRQEVDNE
jgi:hypothetical protein